MSRASQEDNGKNLPVVQLRVFRQAVGSSHHVRLVSPRYGGCMTHWLKGNSQYCAGTSCIWNCARQRKQWKGFGAADVFDPQTKLWMPCAFELTESMELDFRDRWTRGGLWRVHWPHARKGHQEPKRAEFVKQLDPDSCPSEWDIVPCLLNTFHIFEIDLTVRNPMPPRVLVQATAGPDPTEQGFFLPIADHVEQRRWIEKMRDKVANGMASAEASTNGQNASSRPEDTKTR
jgi:hypothetical protein